MATPKTVLITGTSSGIGLAAAVGAARAGWTVVATMRDPAKADPLMAAAGGRGGAGRGGVAGGGSAVPGADVRVGPRVRRDEAGGP